MNESNNPLPPSGALRFLRWFCHPDLLPGIEGDLIELYRERLATLGRSGANRKFFLDVLLLFRPAIIRPVEGTYQLNSYGMLRNYFKVGVRNILKYKAFSFINVFGLAAAMSVSMLIVLMLADQLRYDNFHQKKERTYRILTKRLDSATPNASGPFPLAATLKSEFPAVESATQLVRGVGGDIATGNKSLEMAGYFADDSFFEVFDFPIEAGSRQAALSSPNAVVLTDELAAKLFETADFQSVIGQTVSVTDRGLIIVKLGFGNDIGTKPVDWGNFVVTAVLDTDGVKSHLKFDVLMSAAALPALYRAGKMEDHTNDWERYSYSYTYATLAPGQTTEAFRTSLDALAQAKYSEYEHLKGLQLIPQTLTEITPGRVVGNPASLSLPVEAYYFLGAMALIIMVTACFNYTNLSIARALTRAKEIGVRKVNGAKTRHLMVQFLTESVLTALLSMVIGTGMLLLIRPAFEGLWVNQYLNFDLRSSTAVWGSFLGIALVVGLLAGLFPALHLAGYSPLRALKPLRGQKQGRLGFRKVLITLQFGTSLFFIVTALLIGRQFDHFLRFEYGFRSENIVNIPLQGNDYTTLSTKWRSIAGVADISACEFIPATAMSNGVGVKAADGENDFAGFEFLSVDSGFVGNLSLKLAAGRNLPGSGDYQRYALINEAGAKVLGFESGSDAVGRLIDVSGFDTPKEVVGVLSDFSYQTPAMEDKPGPLLFLNLPERFSYANVRLDGGDFATAIGELRAGWELIDRVHPFRYQFFDEQLASANAWMGDLVAIVGFFAFLAVVISCLGLLGMATYSAERRVKEVGIRKVLGAKNTSLALLLSRQFLALLLVATVIFAPLTYLANNLWLENLPNRVDFGFAIIMTGILILFLLGSVVVASQTIRAASSNPVDVLRMD